MSELLLGPIILIHWQLAVSDLADGAKRINDSVQDTVCLPKVNRSPAEALGGTNIDDG